MNQSLIVPTTESAIAAYSPEFLAKVKAIGDSIVARRKQIQEHETPASKIHKMGASKKKIAWSDIEFVKEDYMKGLLNKYFGGLWSWVAVPPGLQVFEKIGQVAFTGTLEIFESGVMRRFSACGGSPIKVKSGQMPSIDTIINFDNDVKAANTNGFKKSINMLTSICDDVYGKEVEVTTEPVHLSEMTRLYPLMDEKNATSIATYIQSEFGGWEHIPKDKAVVIIANMAQIVNASKTQENLDKTYQENKYGYQKEVSINHK